MERCGPLNLMELSLTHRSVTPFLFEGDATVRVVTRDGLPWFVAADVCRALDISNPRDAVSRLDDDEKGVGLTDTLGGDQEMLIISESGLFTVILRCRDAVKPGTLPHRFRRWVTGEVLPALRRGGQLGDHDNAHKPISTGCVYPEVVALRMVAVAHRAFGVRAAREVWYVTGLPVVPAMRLASPQLDLFALTAQQAQPSVEMRG